MPRTHELLSLTSKQKNSISFSYFSVYRKAIYEQSALLRGLCFSKKNTPWQMLKKNGIMIFKDKCFFHMVKQILVELSQAIIGNNSFELQNKFNDKSKTHIKEVLLLINFYNANTENEQLSMLSDLSNMLEKLMILIIKTLYLEVILMFFEALNIFTVKMNLTIYIKEKLMVL